MTTTLQTRNTALLVVDMQNGFCHPESSFAQLGLNVEMTNRAKGCGALTDAGERATSRGLSRA